MLGFSPIDPEMANIFDVVVWTLVVGALTPFYGSMTRWQVYWRKQRSSGLGPIALQEEEEEDHDEAEDAGLMQHGPEHARLLGDGGHGSAENDGASFVAIATPTHKTLLSTVNLLRRDYGWRSLWIGASVNMLRAFALGSLETFLALLRYNLGWAYGSYWTPLETAHVFLIQLVAELMVIPFTVLQVRAVCLKTRPLRSSREMADFWTLYSLPNVFPAVLLQAIINLGSLAVISELSRQIRSIPNHPGLSPEDKSDIIWNINISASILVLSAVATVLALPLEIVMQKSCLHTLGKPRPERLNSLIKETTRTEASENLAAPPAHEDNARVQAGIAFASDEALSIFTSRQTFLPARSKPYVGMATLRSVRCQFVNLFTTLHTIRSEEGILSGLFRGWPWYFVTWSVAMLVVVAARVILEFFPVQVPEELGAEISDMMDYM